VKLLQTEEPYKKQISTSNWFLKIGILFTLKMVRLYRNMSEMRLWYLY